MHRSFVARAIDGADKKFALGQLGEDGETDIRRGIGVLFGKNRRVTGQERPTAGRNPFPNFDFREPADDRWVAPPPTVGDNGNSLSGGRSTGRDCVLVECRQC